jgi:hypothetical protein
MFNYNGNLVMVVLVRNFKCLFGCFHPACRLKCHGTIGVSARVAIWPHIGNLILFDQCDVLAVRLTRLIFIDFES